MSEETPSQTAPAPAGEAASPSAPAAPSAAGEAPAPAPQAAPERPAWLPEKFKTPEDLAKAYAELEKKIGSMGQKAAPAKAARSPAPSMSPEAAAEVVTVQAETAVRTADLDPDALDEEFATSGRLSPETYAKAEKAGISREFLDRYVEARAVLVQKQAEELMAAAGGKEQWQKVAAWARANLSERALAAFNEAIERGSFEMAKIAIEGIVARYMAANAAPKLIGGTGSGGPSGFRSEAEIKAAMADPRYAADPAYRAEVENRLRATSFLRVRTF